MLMISYSTIFNNLKEIKDNTGICLVVKNDAYGLGIEKITLLASKAGIKELAVIDYVDAIRIRKIDSNIRILLLANSKCNLDILKEYQITPSVENDSEYQYYKENNINMALKVDVGMHRFGVKNLDNKYLLDDMVEEIYFHIPKLTNSYNTIISHYSSLCSQYNKRYHFGGSILYNNYNVPLRIGILAYQNSIKLYGKIIALKFLKKNGVLGYNEEFKASQDMYYAIIDIGYYNGLNRKNKYKVFYKGNYYNSIGLLCMNHLFIEANSLFAIGEYVEFIGNNIDINELCNDNVSLYELLLHLK